MHQLAMRIMAEWCSTPGCHERAEPYNSVDHRGGDFTDEVCRVRDRIAIIADGLAAQTLGRLAKGKPKHYSTAELALRSQRLALARLKRWPKRAATAPTAPRIT